MDDYEKLYEKYRLRHDVGYKPGSSDNKKPSKFIEDLIQALIKHEKHFGEEFNYVLVRPTSSEEDSDSVPELVSNVEIGDLLEDVSLSSKSNPEDELDLSD